MSALLDFAIFPTDKGDSVSQYVSKVIEMIRESGVDYQLTAMGTLIETETFSEGLDIVNKAYAILEPHSDRVYCTMTADIQSKKNDRLSSKVNAIESKIGKVNH